MSLSDVSDQVLTLVITYGAVTLAVVVFLAAVGVPFPSSLFVIAGGAFVQQGVLELAPAIMWTLAGAVIGDLLSFALGRWMGHAVRARFGGSSAWQQGERQFARYGSAAIYLTRWLITPLAIPINLIAGSSDYPPARFGGNVAAGELTWILLYGALGYAFGSQWELISDFVSNFSGVLVGLVLVIGGGVALVRWVRRADA